MQHFAPTDLRRFFTAVDAHLHECASIILLGGSAIALYGVQAGTRDIDTWQTDLRPLADAIVSAREATGLDIPVVPAAVGDVPYNFEDRLQPEQGAWTRLTVLKLEPHDLALSKAVRAAEHDLAAVQALHGIIPLDRETLVTRYLEEMGATIGDPLRLDWNFALLIERLYGDTEAAQIEVRLKEARGRRRS